MTTKSYQTGNVWDHVAAADISSDDVVVMQGVVGIAVSDIANGETGAVQVAGVVKVARTTGEAWSQGDSIAWDASEGQFTKTITPASGDVADCGVAAKASASADVDGYVDLNKKAGTYTA